MKPQERNYSCGPAAIRAAFHVMGRSVTEKALRAHAGTTNEGTDHNDILRALRHYSQRGKEYETKFHSHAWKWLRRRISAGRPVILCVDRWDHWVTVVGNVGSKILLFDPNSKSKYSGLRPYSQDSLLSRWNYKNTFYGIAIY